MGLLLSKAVKEGTKEAETIAVNDASEKPEGSKKFSEKPELEGSKKFSEKDLDTDLEAAEANQDRYEPSYMKYNAMWYFMAYFFVNAVQNIVLNHLAVHRVGRYRYRGSGYYDEYTFFRKAVAYALVGFLANLIPSKVKPGISRKVLKLRAVLIVLLAAATMRLFGASESFLLEAEREQLTKLLVPLAILSTVLLRFYSFHWMPVVNFAMLSIMLGFDVKKFLRTFQEAPRFALILYLLGICTEVGQYMSQSSLVCWVRKGAHLDPWAYMGLVAPLMAINYLVRWWEVERFHWTFLPFALTREWATFEISAIRLALFEACRNFDRWVTLDILLHCLNYFFTVACIWKTNATIFIMSAEITSFFTSAFEIAYVGIISQSIGLLHRLRASSYAAYIPSLVPDTPHGHHPYPGFLKLVDKLQSGDLWNASVLSEADSRVLWNRAMVGEIPVKKMASRAKSDFKDNNVVDKQTLDSLNRKWDDLANEKLLKQHDSPIRKFKDSQQTEHVRAARADRYEKLKAVREHLDFQQQSRDKKAQVAAHRDFITKQMAMTDSKEPKCDLRDIYESIVQRNQEIGKDQAETHGKESSAASSQPWDDYNGFLEKHGKDCKDPNFREKLQQNYGLDKLKATSVESNLKLNPQPDSSSSKSTDAETYDNWFEQLKALESLKEAGDLKAFSEGTIDMIKNLASDKALSKALKEQHRLRSDSPNTDNRASEEMKKMIQQGLANRMGEILEDILKEALSSDTKKTGAKSPLDQAQVEREMLEVIGKAIAGDTKVLENKAQWERIKKYTEDIMEVTPEEKQRYEHSRMRAQKRREKMAEVEAKYKKE